MKLELSKEAIDIILTELDTARNTCNWELDCTFKNKDINNEFHQYWIQRQGTIEKALNEFRRAI